MDVVFLIAFLPTILLGKYIYEMDKVEKEPGGLLFKLFVGGVAAVFLTLILSDLFELVLPRFEIVHSHHLLSLFFYNFITVALLEELCKWLFLYVGSWKDKNFNCLFDGIVYGVFVSLGFATLENLLYVASYKHDYMALILRALLSVPSHVFFGVFMGYFYGMAKKFKNKKKKYSNYILLSMVVPVLLHGVFDFCLSGNNWLYALAYVIFIFFLYILSFKKIKDISAHDKYI